MEGGLFTCQRNKPWEKKANKHWSNRREWRRLEEEEEEDDDEDEGEEIFFHASVYPPLGYFSSSFFSFSSVVVVVVVVVGLEANSFLVPRSRKREAVTYKHTNTHISLSLSLSLFAVPDYFLSVCQSSQHTNTQTHILSSFFFFLTHMRHGQ